MLVELYTQLRINAKAAANLKLLFDVQLHRHDFQAAEHTLSLLDKLVEAAQAAYQHQQITFALMNDEQPDEEKILLHIRKSVQGFLQGNDNRILQKFLSTLEALNPTYAIEAYRYVQDDQKS